MGGGATAAGAGLTMAPNNPTSFYPYFQYAAPSDTTAGYGMAQYPQFYQYAAAAGATTAVAGGLQQYGGAVALSPNSVGQAGIVLVPCLLFAN